jgi:LDH2 family malate/lactate/ureidoglycolate dehydrogenase
MVSGLHVTNIHHVGRLGEFVAMASEEKMIGIMFVNGSRPGGLVAPFGARQRMLGTNPLAFSIPAGSYPPLLADFATSTVAEGKVRIANRKGEKVPIGWLLTRDGKPTDDLKDLYDGGAITTFGEHKGYAISLLIEVLGGILSAERPQSSLITRCSTMGFLPLQSNQVSSVRVRIIWQL